MVGLSQTRTGLLADDFFLMVHDDISGKPRLPDRILGLGLAGALLGELAVVGAIDVENEEVTLTGREPPPIALASEVFRELVAEPRLRVRDWLNYLSQRAPERVAGRLEAWGLMYLKPSRIPVLGGTGRWTPTEGTNAGWPAIDVKLKIYNGKADAHHLMLFGLTRATGLNHESLWEVRDRLQDPAHLEAALSPLDSGPVLLDVLAHTEAAVGSAVTSQRIG